MPPGLSKGLRRGLFDISTPQPQVTPFSNERTIPISGGTSIDGASRGTKRGSSTVLAPQPQRNPTSHEPTILTSIGTSINGVHKRSNRRVSAVSVPQSQLNMSSEPTSPILDGTSTDSAPKLFKKLRGRTRCLASERVLHAAGRKLSVTIKAEDGRPSGANSRFFVTGISFIIRTFAPLQYECFGNIPDQEKESLVFRLLNRSAKNGY